ncbi:MAG: hypothetical protein OEW70_07200, partial [candidate division WOR-3 bacterium]|nr:hypothetical protein [candidate division WOR-3 bacterium]
MQCFNLDYIQTLQSRVLISKFLFLGIMLLFIGLFASPTEMKEIPFHVNGTIEKGTLYRQSATQSVKGVPRSASRNSNTATRTGEFLIDTNIVYLPSSVKEENPEVGFDGTNYLVIWEDYTLDEDNADICGARISQDGTLLDTNIIFITTAQGYQRWPDISFDGTNYLVVWLAEGGEIHGARVNQNGVVLDPNGFLISPDANTDEWGPSIAFDGTNYFVVWELGTIYGARVNQDGIVLDTNGIAICTTGNSYPSVAFGQTDYFVVWTDERSNTLDIYGARVSPDGIVLDTNSIPISAAERSQYDPSVAFDGTNFLVVWGDKRNNDTSYVYGARVNQEGVVLDPNGIAISSTLGNWRYPSVGFDGINYLVVWEDFRHGPPSYYDIYGSRVNQNGIVLDPDGIVISTVPYPEWNPSVIFGGTNHFVVWDLGEEGQDILFARVSRDGVVLDPNGIAISTVVNEQYYPSAAFDGTNYL